MPSEPRNQPSSACVTRAERSTAPFLPKTISPSRSTYCGSRRTTFSGTSGVCSVTRKRPAPTSPTEMSGTPSFPEYSSAFKSVPKGPVLMFANSRMDFTSHSSGITPTSVCLYPRFTSMRIPSSPDDCSLWLPVRQHGWLLRAMPIHNARQVP